MLFLLSFSLSPSKSSVELQHYCENKHFFNTIEDKSSILDDTKGKQKYPYSPVLHITTRRCLTISIDSFKSNEVIRLKGL